MKRKILSITVAATLGGIVAFSGVVLADRDFTSHGPFAFEPIAGSAYDATWDARAPWLLPEGYTQTVISNEANLNIYDGGRDDWQDMNVVNETGRHAGRFLYRTHEVRGVPEGGAVSVVDLKTGKTTIIAQDPTYDALDGIVWTPWGTILFAEEVSNDRPGIAPRGRLFELVFDRRNLTEGVVYDRPAAGRLAHEGIQVGPDGAIYMVDEFRGQTSGYGGGIYRFVPDNYGDLSSGKLYALKADGPDGTGNGSWVGPIDAENAAQDGTAKGATGYQRPEDLQIIGDTLYVAVTEGLGYSGRVLAVNLWSLKVTDYVKPGLNVAVEDKAAKVTGFAKVDNLAVTPDGKLMMIEDNVPSDIWVADKDRDRDGVADKVVLFGSLTDPKAEGTGIYFGKDLHTLFVNVQHSAADDGDGTWAISRTRKHKRD